MKKETAADLLARDILLLETKRAIEFETLKEKVQTSIENLRPINLIKSTFKEAVQSPEIKGGIGKAAIGMATGYLLRKVLFGSSGSSPNPIKNVFGEIFQRLATNVATKNSDKIKESSIDVFDIVKKLIINLKEKVS